MLETGKDILKNTKDLFYQEIEKRFSNPFLGAFVLSWIFCNWDFLYVVLFVDQQYVSFLPQVINGDNHIFTKYEYIKSLGIITWGRFILFPLVASFIFVIFVEWGTTYLNLGVKYIKEKIIEKREIIGSKTHENLKIQLVEQARKYRQKSIIQNDEIISLQAKNDELEFSINDKVTEKLKEEEKKNIKRIKELEQNLDRTLKLSDERLQENNFLNNKTTQLEQSIESIKIRDNDYKREISNLLNNKNSILEQLNVLQKENKDLKNKLEELDKPLDESLKNEYEIFKNSEYFQGFDDLIEKIEDNPYSLRQDFFAKYLKYLVIKGILVEQQEDFNNSSSFRFTPKGDKFVEFYLDEDSKSGKSKNIGTKREHISVEDLPF